MMEISVQGEVMKELGHICNELYNVSSAGACFIVDSSGLHVCSGWKISKETLLACLLTNLLFVKVHLHSSHQFGDGNRVLGITSSVEPYRQKKCQ